jgi:hypothetical protein
MGIRLKTDTTGVQNQRGRLCSSHSVALGTRCGYRVVLPPRRPALFLIRQPRRYRLFSIADVSTESQVWNQA